MNCFCGEPHHSHGYCSKHATRFRRWGSPFYKAKAANGEHSGCKVPGCTHDHHGHGYCGGHLRRLNSTGVLVDMYGCLDLSPTRGRPRNHA
jgi:hypothetical protein